MLKNTAPLNTTDTGQDLRGKRRDYKHVFKRLLLKSLT